MIAYGRVVKGLLVGFLIVSLMAPLPAWGAAASLGTARGMRGVELSLDDGKTWLSLGTVSLPVLEGTRVRSTSGGALIDLVDGSRINVLPFSAIDVRQTASATEVSLVYGRLGLRLPPETRVEIRTPSVRLEPVRKETMVADVVLSGEGTMGLQMKQGSLRVHEISGGQRVMLASSSEPVFLPKRPKVSGSFFPADAPATPHVGAKGVFSSGGESLGYLQPEGQLVIHPGFTNDLTQPFSSKLIRLAMAQIPEQHRSDAMPVFDVNGGYTGYLAGPVFYAQAQVAQAVAGDGGNNTGRNVALGLLGLLGLFAGLCIGDVICDDDERPATPLRP